MDTIQAILLGLVQGFSEFLPISSSAHLVFVSNIFAVLTGNQIDIESSEHIFLDIMLHLGTLISILIYFRKELYDIVKAFCKAIVKRDFSDLDAKLGLYIIFGTFITVLIAYPLKGFAESLTTSPITVATLLILTGFVLFFSEFKSKHMAQHTEKLDWKKALIIGIAQGLAAFPGFSRSGWTIAAGLFSGLDRVTSTRYSFLLVVPIILGTSIFYPILEIKPAELATYNWTGIIIGTLISAIIGYICIKYFLKFVSKFSMNFFAYYCIVVGLLVITFFAKIYYGLNIL